MIFTLKNGLLFQAFRYILIGFLLNTSAIFAQNSGEISGTCISQKVALEFVKVLVYSKNDSTKLIVGATTDTLGNFNFKQLILDTYLLKFKLNGFIPIQLEIKLDTLVPRLHLDPVDLKEYTQQLSGVEIISNKELIKKTTDGFMILAKDNLTQAGGTASDLLKSVPSVVVDAEGGITIRGKSPLILVNGRNSNLSTTDRIPASSVESIEIINNPSSKYDADSDGGIILIKLKKNTEKGNNYAAVIGAGYGAKARVSSSFIMNHQNGKWNMGLAYDNRFAGRTRKIDAKRTNLDLLDTYYLIQHRLDDRLEQTQNLKFNLDFSPNAIHNFSFEAIGNLSGQDNLETLNSLIQAQNLDFYSQNSRFSNEIGREKALEFAFNYSKKFSDKRKNLSVNLTSSPNLESENTDISTQSLLIDGSTIGSPLLQRTKNYQTSNVSNAKIDLSQPIGAKATLEYGYKGIFRFTDADFQNLILINNNYVLNELSSNIFNFQEQIHAAYLQYKSFIGKMDSAKWKYDFGMRVEQVFNLGKTVNNAQNFRQQYFNFFPSANIAYFLNATDFLKLSYSRRINRPMLGQLNPFVDITDSLNQHGGNPSLGPELISALEASYYKKWRKISFTSTLYYRYATNIIRQYTVLRDNGVAFTQAYNFGLGITYGAEGIISIYPTKFWTISASVSAYQQHISGNSDSETIVNDVFSWYGKVINNFSLWKKGKLQLITNYNSPIATPQGKRVEVYYADLGYQQKIMKDNGALSIVMTDVFNTQRNGSSAITANFIANRKFKMDTRAIMITFAYTFKTALKDELLENKFNND